jgi:endogenous inhibitor of DNA gyrase (YacG/DUF329 family)
MGKAFESIKAGLTEAMAHAKRDPAAPRIVNCPACGKAIEWVAENRYRPFCSARCKGVDLGAWASDQYRIAAKEEPKPDPDAAE